MYVYTLIKRFLRALRIFNDDTQIDTFNKEYKIILNEIARAKTLGHLFNTRAMLIKYNENVKNLGSPTWGTNSVKFLEAKWNRQYRLWKSRG